MGRKDNQQEENLRRVKELENLVEAHTRTERHLEQYSSIAKEEQISNTQRLQEKRQEEIENIENILVTGQHNNEYDE
ncbi:MAG: hypothetical protein ACLFMO_02925 [Eubacteriales bacterium]